MAGASNAVSWAAWLKPRWRNRWRDRGMGTSTSAWAGVAWRPGVAGAPLIEGAVAHFECFNRGRHDEGDHLLFIGQVEHCDHRPGASPLLFHGGQFYTEHPL